MEFPTYRDELVQQIKEAGQELINKAEFMLGDGLKLISSVNIYLAFKTTDDDGVLCPEIHYDVTTMNEETLRRMVKKL